MENELNKHIKKAELTAEVPPDKFDRHMKKARRDDIASRRRIFIAQSEEDNDPEQISPSVY